MRREAFREKVREARRRSTSRESSDGRKFFTEYFVRVASASFASALGVMSVPRRRLSHGHLPHASRERPRVEHLSDPSEILQFDVDLFLLVRGLLP